MKILAMILLMCFQNSKPLLSVKISGFPSDKGKAMIAVYNKAEQFPEGKRIHEAVVEVKNGEAHLSIPLERGKYALAVFHDANNNKKLDKNILGIPTESYGFSRNAKASFSAPSFSDAAFDLQTNKTIYIQLN